MNSLTTPARLRNLVTVVLAVAVLVVATPDPAVAATKSACSGGVCTRAEYSGSTVTEWRATFYPGSGYNCRTARFWRDGAFVQQEQTCGTGTLAAYASTPFTASSGTELCVSFVGESGYPCITL